MNKYALFKRNKQKYIAQDLSAGRYFVVGEERYATYEKGKLIFENGETWTAFRVWHGSWPKHGVTYQEAIEMIEAANPGIFNDRPGYKRKPFIKR